MKLLEWMHRKTRQNNTEPLTNFARVSGNSSSCFSTKGSFDEQQCHAEPTYSFAQVRQPNRKCQRFSNEVNANIVEESSMEESPNEFFHGFLAIGTLGLEPLDTEPPTPTFPMPFQNVTGKETQITEKELKLINNEIEKFLEAEAKEVADESSARSSQASIITSNNKQLHDADEKGSGYSATCPLQKYLFGSSIELDETAVEEKKEKTSLEELFRRNDAIHEDSIEKVDNMEKQAKQKSTNRLIKKMRKMLHSTAMSCAIASSEKGPESVASKRKLHKVLRIFHRKVYPEDLIAEKEFTKAEMNEATEAPCEHRIGNKEHRKKKRSDHISNPKKEPKPSEICSRMVKNGAMKENGERWIKTDADYLVLEL